MAKTKTKNIISKDKRFDLINDLILHYDDGNKSDDWYGEIFEKLMDQHDSRLVSLHKVTIENERET